MSGNICYAGCLLLVICLLTLAEGSVVVNEFELNPPSDQPYAVEWIELFNPGDEDVDIGGWQTVIISTVPGESGAQFPWSGTITVPVGTVLKAGEYRVLTGDQRWDHGFNATVILYDQVGNEVDRTPMLTDDRDDGSDWSRYPDGMDTDRTSDWAYIPSTRGKPNVLPY